MVGPDRHSIWLSAGSSLGRGFSCRPIIPFTFRAGAHTAGVEEQLNLEQLQQVSGIHLHVVEEEREGGMEGNYAEVQERIQCDGNKTNMQPHLEIDWKKATTESVFGGEKTEPRLPQIWKDWEPRQSSVKEKKDSVAWWHASGSKQIWHGFLIKKCLPVFQHALWAIKYMQEGSPEEPEIPVVRKDGTCLAKYNKVQSWMEMVSITDGTFLRQK